MSSKVAYIYFCVCEKSSLPTLRKHFIFSPRVSSIYPKSFSTRRLHRNDNKQEKLPFFWVFLNPNIQISLLFSSPSPWTAQTQYLHNLRVLPKPPSCLNQLPRTKCHRWRYLRARLSTCRSPCHFQKEPNLLKRRPVAGLSQLKVRRHSTMHIFGFQYIWLYTCERYMHHNRFNTQDSYFYYVFDGFEGWKCS